jgi:hypothetical protein
MPHDKYTGKTSIAHKIHDLYERNNKSPGHKRRLQTMGRLKVLQLWLLQLSAPGNSNKTVRRTKSKLLIGSTMGQEGGLGQGS